MSQRDDDNFEYRISIAPNLFKPLRYMPPTAKQRTCLLDAAIARIQIQPTPAATHNNMNSQAGGGATASAPTKRNESPPEVKYEPRPALFMRSNASLVRDGGAYTCLIESLPGNPNTYDDGTTMAHFMSIVISMNPYKRNIFLMCYPRYCHRYNVRMLPMMPSGREDWLDMCERLKNMVLPTNLQDLRASLHVSRTTLDQYNKIVSYEWWTPMLTMNDYEIIDEAKNIVDALDIGLVDVIAAGLLFEEKRDDLIEAVKRIRVDRPNARKILLDYEKTYIVEARLRDQLAEWQSKNYITPLDRRDFPFLCLPTTHTLMEEQRRVWHHVSSDEFPFDPMNM